MNLTVRNHNYLRYSFSYYLTVRSAAINALHPIAGNLFHHTFEMLSKAYSSDYMGDNELKNIFKHKLPVLWTRLKSSISSDRLNKWDDKIEELDKFEEIRYPGKSYSVFFGIFKNPEGRKSQKQFYRGPKIEVHTFLFLEEMDELYKAIVTSLTLSPDVFKNELHNDESKKLYGQNNRHKLW